jgi:hypothetical protein
MEPGIFHHSKTFGAGGKLEVEEHLELGELARYEWMQGKIGRLSIERLDPAGDSKEQGCSAGNVRTVAMLGVKQMRASCHLGKKLRVDNSDRGLSQIPEQK